MRPSAEPEPPRLSDEGRWYTEHTALVVTTLKWALLGAAAGLCVGGATRAFLWSLGASSRLVDSELPGALRPYFLLPLALPACVWLVRNFAPSAKGHGTEAVIAAIHARSGKIDWRVAPVKLLATVLTLAFGGSVGKEGPCAQIGAAITSLFADVLRLDDKDRRRLVICGVGAGFAAVFGTPVSGALFGIEVLYLGRIEYPVLFPCLVAGTPGLRDERAGAGSPSGPVSPGTPDDRAAGHPARGRLRADRPRAHREPARPRAAPPPLRAPPVPRRGRGRGGARALLSRGRGGLRGPRPPGHRGVARGHRAGRVARLPLQDRGDHPDPGDGGQRRHRHAALLHRGHERGGPRAPGWPPARGHRRVRLRLRPRRRRQHADRGGGHGHGAAPPRLGVYAALCAGTAFLLVGHRSVYASQKLGLSKSGGLEVPVDVAIGDVHPAEMRIRKGSMTESVLDGVKRGVKGTQRRRRRSR